MKKAILTFCFSIVLLSGCTLQKESKQMEEKTVSQEELTTIYTDLHTLPQEIQDKYSDNEIIYIGDIVYDYYENKGFFEENNNDEVELDVDDLIEFVRTCLKKDTEAEYADEDIEFLVRGELDYDKRINWKRI